MILYTKNPNSLGKLKRSFFKVIRRSIVQNSRRISKLLQCEKPVSPRRTIVTVGDLYEITARLVVIAIGHPGVGPAGHLDFADQG